MRYIVYDVFIVYLYCNKYGLWIFDVVIEKYVFFIRLFDYVKGCSNNNRKDKIYYLDFSIVDGYLGFC